MIHAIKLIGDYARDKKNTSLLEMLVDNPNEKGTYNTVLVIIFENKGDNLKYSRIDVEEFSLRKLAKYAYKQGSPRGGDYTPTSRFVELNKTFSRVLASLNNACKTLKGNTSDEKIILAIRSILEDETQAQKIMDDIKGITYNDGAVLTIAVDEDGQRRYVGDFSQFTKLLIEEFEKSLYLRKSFSKKEQKSIGTNNRCYICSQVKEKTYGYASTFAFYTLDKQGFTSGGFQRDLAWKNYPVCPECAYSLEIGKKYIEDHLSANFCGLNYFIIPKSIFPENEDNLDEVFVVLDDMEEKIKLSLKKDTVKRLAGSQKELFNIMTEFENYMNFNIMFYDSPGGSSEFRILLYVEDVLPSYMQTIFAAKDYVEGLPLFKNLPGKDKKKYDLTFGFDLIAYFFPIKDFLKNFLEITNNIFSERQVSYPLLINRFMDVIGAKFCNNDPYWLDVRKALAILLFLNRLGLLNRRKEGQVRMTTIEHDTQFEEFFDQYNDFFDSDVKRAVFLEGVLAQKLLNLQKVKRDGAAPFRERLNGLKLNEKIIKRLLPEIQNKFEEYKANYYTKLEKLISKYFLAADFSTLSNDEISFYFVTGMNLADEFLKEKDGGNMNEPD